MVYEHINKYDLTVFYWKVILILLDFRYLKKDKKSQQIHEI